MSMFSNTDKTKTPYKFSKKQFRCLLKKYLPSVRVQEGDKYSILVFTFDFDGHIHKNYTTRYVIVHRSIDNAVLIWENNHNDWGGATFSILFDVDGLCSHVEVCESFDDFEGFLAQISNNLEKGIFNMSHLVQIPLEFASIHDEQIKDSCGGYIRLPFNTVDGSYKYKTGDFEKYSSQIDTWWKDYKTLIHALFEMNPAFDK